MNIYVMDEEALHQQGDQFTSTNYEHTHVLYTARVTFTT